MLLNSIPRAAVSSRYPHLNKFGSTFQQLFLATLVEFDGGLADCAIAFRPNGPRRDSLERSPRTRKRNRCLALQGRASAPLQGYEIGWLIFSQGFALG